MAYTTAEQSEEPVTGNDTYLSTGLPPFRKKDNPGSNVSGDLVFSQDEESRIETFGFADQQAVSVLSAAVERCRQAHQGHVLRQKIEIQRCSIVECRYRHGGKTHAIFVNPSHGLVEDISGPIQAAIENMDVLAQKAFDEKRYEEAYRVNLRSLCMDEATDAEKRLRDQILKRLTSAYRNVALYTWLAASLAWLLVGATMPQPQLNFGVLLGLIPLLAAVHLFARDTALRFRRRGSRVVAAVLIGFSAFLSGAAINANSFERGTVNHGVDWFPFGLVMLVLIALAIARAEERARRTEIEKHAKDFPNAQVLETYVCGLDPKGNTDFQAGPNPV